MLLKILGHHDFIIIVNLEQSFSLELVDGTIESVNHIKPTLELWWLFYLALLLFQLPDPGLHPL